MSRGEEKDAKKHRFPSPGSARARITYDPLRCDEAALQRAITEPYYDSLGALWRFSPFEIEGYDPLGIEEDDTPQ